VAPSGLYARLFHAFLVFFWRGGGATAPATYDQTSLRVLGFASIMLSLSDCHSTEIAVFGVFRLRLKIIAEISETCFNLDSL